MLGSIIFSFTRYCLFLCAVQQVYAGNTPSTQKSSSESDQKRALQLAYTIGTQKTMSALSHKGVYKTSSKTPDPNRIQKQSTVFSAVEGKTCHSTRSLEHLFQELSLSGKNEKVVNTTDGRQKITTTHTFPWSTQCVLSMSFPTYNATGSGTLIGPNLLLTAAHNLYDRDTQQKASSVKVIPGFNAGHCPFGAPPVVDVFYYPDAYVKTGNEDYALVILHEDISEQTGHMGLWSSSEEALRNTMLSVTGYPGDKRADNGGQLGLYTMSRKPSYINNGILSYTIDTSSGQSGSGVYCKEGDDFLVVGVHIQGGNILNSATLLTKDRIDTLRMWMHSYQNTLLLNTKSTLCALTGLSTQNTQTPAYETWLGLSALIEAGCFDALVSLDLSHQGLKNISAVSRLKNLTAVNLSHNALVDANPLSDLKEIRHLIFSNNALVNIDGLKNLTLMKGMALSDNFLVNIDALSGLTQLEFLALYNNRITSMNALKFLKNLKQLNIGFNRIEDIGPITRLTDLEFLALHGNAIVDIHSLKELCRNDFVPILVLLPPTPISNNIFFDLGAHQPSSPLKKLFLHNNRIVHIEVLEKFKNLEEVSLANNPITDFKALTSLKNLKKIDVEDYTQEQRLSLKKVRKDLF